MHQRTRATRISARTKAEVNKRDKGMCIFCGRPGLPEAHVISRAQGGMGIPKNIVTVCRECHRKMDESADRLQMVEAAKKYLWEFYGEFSEEEVKFKKWSW